MSTAAEMDRQREADMAYDAKVSEVLDDDGHYAAICAKVGAKWPTVPALIAALYSGEANQAAIQESVRALAAKIVSESLSDKALNPHVSAETCEHMNNYIRRLNAA